jgi:hypothetical protein
LADPHSFIARRVSTNAPMRIGAFFFSGRLAGEGFGSTDFSLWGSISHLLTIRASQDHTKPHRLKSVLLEPSSRLARSKMICVEFSRVEILRIMLCSSCATIAAAEEKIWCVMASGPIRDELSSQSSFCILADAQGKRISAARFAPYPHFHSDGYYYGLYTSFKTGYSNSSQSQFCLRLPAEEIQRWNSV